MRSLNPALCSALLILAGCGKSNEQPFHESAEGMARRLTEQANQVQAKLGATNPLQALQEAKGMAPAQPGGPSASFSQAEAILKEALEAYDGYCELLSHITDESSAVAASARYQELKNKILSVEGPMNSIKGMRLTGQEDAQLDRTYRNRLIQVVQRMAREKQRVMNLPGGVFLALESGVSSGRDTAASPQPPFGQPPLPASPFNRPPNFGSPGPGKPLQFPTFDADKANYIQRFGPENIAVLQITNVAGLDVHDTLAADFKKLLDKEPNHRMFTTGNLTQALVAPVSDLKGFASKITFGKVTRIDELTRTIEVEADRSKFPKAKEPDFTPPNIADRPGRPQRPDPKKPGDVAEAVGGVLDDLKSGDRNRRREALRQLIEMKPNERQAEVGKALEALLEETDPFLRSDALKALGTWGAKEQVPLLIKQLGHSDSFFRGNVIELLGKLKDERAVEPVAARLTEFFDRSEASKALQEMGVMAEKTVLKYVTHPDSHVAQEACKVLKVIGTRASAQLLQAAARQRRDSGLARAAQEALFDIANRDALARAAEKADPKKPAAAAATKPADEGAPDAGKLGKELLSAQPARQLEIIQKLEETKRPEFTQALTDAIPKLPGKTQDKAREALASRLTRMNAKTLKSYLEGDNAELRRAAATACGNKGAKELVPDLIALLTKEDAEVAQAAHEALKAITAQKIELAKNASAADRQIVAERWKAWWQANGSKP